MISGSKKATRSWEVKGGNPRFYCPGILMMLKLNLNPFSYCLEVYISLPTVMAIEHVIHMHVHYVTMVYELATFLLTA